MATQTKTLSTIVDISGQVDPSVAKAAKNAINSLDGINLKAVAAAASVAALSAGLVLGVKKGGEALFNLGKTAQNAERILTETTGATGERLEELSNTYQNVYKKGFGESMESVATDVAKISNATLLVGEELEAATEKAYLLSDAYGYDVADSAKAASILMKNFGLDAEKAYGLMAAGAQYGADVNGDMLDIITEYSGQFADLGLSSDQFMASLLTGAEEGLFSLDKVGDAVKEFNIRAKDGSDSSKEAFESLGYDADTLFATFAAGGEESEAAFFDVVNSLEALEDPLQKNQIGVALFGSQFEDLGDGVLPVLSSIEDSAIASESAIGKLNKLHFDDMDSALTALQRNMEMAFLPVGQELITSVVELMPVVTEAFSLLTPVIETLSTTMLPFVSELSGELMPVLEEILPVITNLGGEFLSILLPPILEIVKKVLPPLLRLVQAFLPLLDPLIGLLEPILSLFIALLDPIIWLVDTALTPLVSIFSKLLGQVLPPLIDILQNVLIPIFSSGLRGAIEGLAPLIETITGIFGGITDFIQNVFTGNWEGAWQNIVDIFGNIFTGIVELFKAPFNFIINGINGMIEGVNGITIPDWVPGIGGMGFEMPMIPALAKGGFTEGVSIAGEAGKEAVLSFDPQYRDDNIGYWQEAGRLLGAGELSGGSSSTTVTTTTEREVKNEIKVTFAPVFKLMEEMDPDTLLEKLKAIFPEFVDMLLDALQKGEEENYEPEPIY